MRLLFLDIDGVLNSDIWYQSEAFNQLEAPYSHFDPRCIASLNQLIKKTNAAIVISSTWRNKYALADLKTLFTAIGAQVNIIGVTPQLKKEHEALLRGNEIMQWCKENEHIIGCSWKDYHDFAILDDNSDMLFWQKDNFFQTDRYVGLTPSVKRNIERFFASKSI